MTVSCEVPLDSRRTRSYSLERADEKVGEESTKQDAEREHDPTPYELLKDCLWRVVLVEMLQKVNLGQARHDTQEPVSVWRRADPFPAERSNGSSAWEGRTRSH